MIACIIIVFAVFVKYNIRTQKGQQKYIYRKETVKKLLTNEKVCAKIDFADFEKRLRLYLSWIEDSATNRGVGGSNPSRRAIKME